MNKYMLVIVGVVIGLLLPFVIDFVLFGDFTPCKLDKKYDDGTVVLMCRGK